MNNNQQLIILFLGLVLLSIFILNQNNGSKHSNNNISVDFDFKKTGHDDQVIIKKDGIYIYRSTSPIRECLDMITENCRGYFIKISDAYWKTGKEPRAIFIHDHEKDGNADIWIVNHNGDIKVLRNIGNFEFVDITSQIKNYPNDLLQQILKLHAQNPKSNHCGFRVIVPNQIGFLNSRVTIVSGSKYYTKYHIVGSGLNNSGIIDFDLPHGSIIDKVKIRTMYGKEYNYDQQKYGGVLKVEPIPHFEHKLNYWRSTSMA